MVEDLGIDAEDTPFKGKKEKILPDPLSGCDLRVWGDFVSSEMLAASSGGDFAWFLKTTDGVVKERDYSIEDFCGRSGTNLSITRVCSRHGDMCHRTSLGKFFSITNFL